MSGAFPPPGSTVPLARASRSGLRPAPMVATKATLPAARAPAGGAGGVGDTRLPPSARTSAGHTVESKVAKLVAGPQAKLRPSQLLVKLKEVGPGPSPAALKHQTEIIELLNIRDYTAQTDTIVDLDRPLFAPVPALLEFRDFHGFEPVTQRVTFRNMDKYPRRMRVISADTPYFKVTGPFAPKGGPLVDSRIPPGGEVAYNVTFSPQNVDDYEYDLVCVTEREKFLVPVRARGPRPALTFPDAMAFPPTPVKTSATKTFTVHNTGTKAGEFYVACPEAAFTAAPSRAVLEPGRFATVTVTFAPGLPGDFSCDVPVAFGLPGVNLEDAVRAAASASPLSIDPSADAHVAFIATTASAHEIDVRLSAPHVKVDPTYVSLAGIGSVALVNRSDTPVAYRWCAYESVEAEEARRSAVLETLEAEYEGEVAAARAAAEAEAEAAAATGLGASAFIPSASEASSANNNNNNAVDAEAELGVYEDVDEDGDEAESAVAAARRGSRLASVARSSAQTRDSAAPSDLYAPSADGDHRASEEDAGVAGGRGAAAAGGLAASSSTGGVPAPAPSSPERAVPAAPGARLACTLAAIDRKYRALRAAALADSYAFDHPVFSVQPASGTAWSHSALDFAVKFAPSEAGEQSCLAYLEVQGRAGRLPVALSGLGIGPKLVLGYDMLDLGDITVTSVHRYDVLLLNKGLVPATWTVVSPPTPWASRFIFDPATSEVPAGETHTASLYFTSDVLGSFEEVFEILIDGNDRPLRLTVKGRVVLPRLLTDFSELKYGDVPFGFPLRRTVTLTNASDVGVTYAARVPADGVKLHPHYVDELLAVPGGTYLEGRSHHEFTLTPATAFLGPGEAVALEVVFTPQTIRSIGGSATSHSLWIDVQGVAEGVLRLPLSATISAPRVASPVDILAYGICFIRHAYTMEVRLTNPDPLPGRIQVLPQDERDVVVGSLTWEADAPAIDAEGNPLPSSDDSDSKEGGEAPRSAVEGIIPADGTCTVRLRLTCNVLGPVILPVFIRVVGSDAPPIKLELQATSRGPRLVLEPSDVLAWDTIECLTPVEKCLTLVNDCPIPAPIKLRMKDTGTRPHFTLGWADAVLAPHEERSLPITAFLDDNVGFKEELIIDVAETGPTVLPLTAKGHGTTIRCQYDLDAGIAFGPVFTTNVKTITVTLENRGRKSQMVSWVNATARERETAYRKAEKARLHTATRGLDAAAKEAARAAVTPLPDPTFFSVDPTVIILPPATQHVFTFYAQCPHIGPVTEAFELQTKSEHERTPTLYKALNVSADFQNPLLQFTPASLGFEHWHSAAMDPPEDAGPDFPFQDLTQTQPVTLTNLSDLPLDFTLSVAAPLSLDSYEFLLAPGASTVVNVTFDPLYREDKTSHVVDTRITATYKEHGRKDALPVYCDINFPNVAIERSDVAFGCVLNDTQSTQIVRVANTSKLPVDLEWYLVENEEAARREALEAGLPYIPINQAFDITPIRARLEPGEVAPVEFLYYAHPGRAFRATAVCNVSGGPEYEVAITGEAHTASFRLDRQLLEFGNIPYDSYETRELVISNTGKIDYNFSATPQSVAVGSSSGASGPDTATVASSSMAGDGNAELMAALPDRIVVTPSSGTVPAGGKLTLAVRLRPGVPGLVDDRVLIRVAHFEPVKVRVLGEGIHAAVVAPTLPPAGPGSGGQASVGDLTWSDAVAQARATVAARRMTGRAGKPPAVTAETVSPRELLAAGALSPTTPSLFPRSPQDTYGRAVGGGDAGGLDLSPAPSATPQRLGRSARAPGAAGSPSVGAMGSPQAPASSSPEALSVEAEVHAEALRLLFAAHLANRARAQRSAAETALPTEEATHAASRAASKGRGGGGGGRAATLAATGALPRGGGATATRGRTGATGASATTSASAAPSMVRTEDFVGGRYLVDLGHIVRGDVRTVTFPLVAVGKAGSGVLIDKALLTGSGFDIAPGRIGKLVKGEGVDVTVSLDTRPDGPGVPRGSRTKEFPLGPVLGEAVVKVSKGPIIVLVLQANVVLPELRVSPAALDFGPVIVGQEREAFFQVHNVSPVRCRWSILPPPPQLPTKRSDREHFTIASPDGDAAFDLAPGQRALLSASFRPVAQRDFNAVVTFQIESNPTTVPLAVCGRGEDVGLAFALQPEGAGAPIPGALVEVGPIQPCKAPAFRVVTMTNTSAVPVEVFSADFDAQAKDEEAKNLSQNAAATTTLAGTAATAAPLASTGAVGAGVPVGGMARRPARAPDAAFAPKAAPSEADMELDAIGVEGEAGGDALHIHTITGGEEDSAAGGEAEPLVPPAGPLAHLRSPRMQDRALNVVVMGPPCSGVTTLATAIASALGVACLTLDDVLLWARSGAGGAALAAKLRAVLPAALTRSAALAQLGEALAEAEKEAAAAAAAAAEPAKKEGSAKGARKPASAPGMDLGPTKPPAQPPTVPRLPVGLVAEALKARLRLADCAKGVVIDGLRCVVLRGPVDAAAAVRGAVDGAPVRVVQLAPPASEAALQGLADRRAALVAAASARLAAAEAVLAAVNPSPPSTAASTGRKGAPAPAPAAERPVPTEAEVAAATAEVAAARAALAWYKPVAVPDWAPPAGMAIPPGLSSAGEAQELTSSSASVLGLLQRTSNAVLSPRGELASVEPVLRQPNFDGDGAVGASTTLDIDVQASPDAAAGEAIAWLPALPPDFDPFTMDYKLPPPETYFLFPVKGGGRLQAGPTPTIASHFRLLKDVAKAAEEAAPPAPPAAPEPEPAPAAPPASGRPPTSQASARAGSGKKAPEPAPAPAPAPAPPPAPVYGDFTEMPSAPLRWTLAPGQTVTFAVQFASSSVGIFDTAFGFGVLGSQKEFKLPLRGTCAVPSVSSDPRNVFMSRAKTRPAGPHAALRKKFCTARGVFDFGPLPAGRWAGDRSPAAAALHAETWRITNVGLFTASINFKTAGPDAVLPWLRGSVCPDELPAPPAAEAAPAPAPAPEPAAPVDPKAKPDPKAKAGAAPEPAPAPAAPEPPASCFVIEPAHIPALGVGETVEVTVWAFPPACPPPKAPGADGAAPPDVLGYLYSNTIVGEIEGNPASVSFPVTAVGTDTALKLDGPWVEKAAAAAAAAAAAPPPPPAAPAKGGKAPAAPAAPEPPATPAVPEAVVEFEKQILGHCGLQTFKVVSNALTPVAWRIDTSGLSKPSAPEPAAAAAAAPAPAGKGAAPAKGGKDAAPAAPAPAAPEAPADVPVVFSFSPSSGILQPGQSVEVTVALQHNDETKRRQTVTIDFVDAADGFAAAEAAAAKAAEEAAAKAAEAAAAAAARPPSGAGKKDAKPPAGKAAAPAAPAPAAAAPAPTPGPWVPVIQRLPLTLTGEVYKLKSTIRFDAAPAAPAPAAAPAATPGKPGSRPGTSSGGKKPDAAAAAPAPAPVVQEANPTTGSFDFGHVRVGEAVTRFIPMTNTGAYPFVYAVTPVPGSLAQELLTVSPAEGTLEPGASVRVEVTFRATRELRVRPSKMLTLTTGPSKDQVVDTIPVTVTGAASYSQAVVIPSKSINFGACRTGTVRERTLEVRNTGAFAFDMHIIPAGSPADAALLEAAAAGPEGLTPAVLAATLAKAGAPAGAAAAAPVDPKAKKDPKAAAAAAPAAPGAPNLAAAEAAAKAGDGPVSEFGRFFLSTISATVESGKALTIPARYFACGGGNHKTRLRVFITGYEYPLTGGVATFPGGLEYELLGESCIPGINGTDMAAVFEEHAIAPALAAIGSAAYVPSAAGTGDAAGAGSEDVEALAAPASPIKAGSPRRSPSPRASPRAGAPAGSSSSSSPSVRMFTRTRCGFGLQEKTFSFGTVLCSVHKDGVTERFAVQNPTKIPVTVTCAVKAAGGGDLGTDAFSVSPATLEIPPHEARFVSVTFKPSAVRTYSATFVAEAEGGFAPDTKALTFGLTGDGSMPTVAITEPPAAARRASDGRLMMDFGRVATGKGKASPLTLTNTGVFPAVVQVALSPSAVFKFVEAPAAPGAVVEASSLMLAPAAPVLGAAPGALPGRSVSLTVAPGSSNTLYLAFAPGQDAVTAPAGSTEASDLSPPGLVSVDAATSAASYESEISLSVSHNAFESDKVGIIGTAQGRDLWVEGLPEEPPTRAKAVAVFAAVKGEDAGAAPARPPSGKAAPAKGGKDAGKGGKDAAPAAAAGAAAGTAAPGSGDYTIFFPDAVASGSSGFKPAEVRFALVNGGAFPVRFEWPASAVASGSGPAFEFTPRVGHIPPGGRCPVTASFLPDPAAAAPSVVTAPVLALSYQKVTYAETAAAAAAADRAAARTGAQRPPTPGKAGGKDAKAPPAKDAKAAPAGKAPAAAAPAAGAGGVRLPARLSGPAVAEPYVAWTTGGAPLKTPEALVAALAEEPAYAVIDEAGLAAAGAAASVLPTVPVAEEAAKAVSVSFAVSAVADAPRLQLVPASTSPEDAAVVEAKALQFGPTKMFASRNHSVAVKNPSVVPVTYLWEVAHNAVGPAESGQPFTVSPASGVLAPGETGTFTVTFAPTDAADNAATATMVATGLAAASVQPVALSLTGRSQRPLVHLEVPPAGNYLSQRSVELPGPSGVAGPLDGGIQLLEFSSIGVGNKVVRRFYVINTTAAPYDFSWDFVGPPPTGAGATPAAAFNCLTPKGLIQPGKRVEVGFEFTPPPTPTPANAAVESFWRFSIPSQGVSQLFLLAGMVKEPVVYYDRPSLQFQPRLLGASTTEIVHLVNEEDVPMSFDVDPECLRAELGSLRVSPSAGPLPPRGKAALEVTFAPQQERAFNANLRVKVSRATAPLSLNIKAEGFALHESLVLDNGGEDDGAGAVLSATGRNLLDFGAVQVHERASKRVVITNTGAFPMDFSWSALLPGAGGSAAAAPASPKRGARGAASSGMNSPPRTGAVPTGNDPAFPVSVAPLRGRVPRGGSVTCELEFKPTAEVSLRGAALQCLVANTKAYRLDVEGMGTKPSLEFSLLDVDFGDVFVHRDPAQPPIPVTRVLRITSKEPAPSAGGKDCSVQCLFLKRAHLVVGFDAAVLAPGQAVDVPITLLPRECIGYGETIPFEINGLHTVEVRVRANAIPLLFDAKVKVPGASPRKGKPVDAPLVSSTVAAGSTSLDFGALRPGQDAARNVTLTNLSKRVIVVELVDPPAASGGAGPLAQCAVSFEARRHTVRPRDTIDIPLRFAPSVRVPAFKMDLLCRMAAGGAGGQPYGDFSAPFPLMEVSGACLGTEVSLEQDTLAFGAVVAGAKVTKTLHIYNTGDVPVVYNWDAASLASVAGNFTIAPVSGSVRPKSDVALTVTFHPGRLGTDIRAEKLKLAVEGVPTPLFLTCSGDCVAQPAPSVPPVALACRVRETATATITIPPNPTDVTWTLTPVFSNDMFSGPSTIDVPPRSSGTAFEVAYKPVRMTKLAPPAPAAAEAAPAPAPTPAKGGKAPPPAKGAPPPEPAAPAAPSTPVPINDERLPAQHDCTLFFALPDGSGVAYPLVGRASAPAPAATLAFSGPAKRPLVFTLPVTNFLRSTQRFAVTWNAAALPPTSALRAAKSLDVPGLATREFKVTYTAMLEGKSTAVLVFQNLDTQEYMYFEVALETTAPSTVDTLHLEAVVRQCVSQVVTLDNPLAAAGVPISFSSMTCDHPCVRVVPLGDLTGQPEGKVRIDFRPLVPIEAGGATRPSTASAPAKGAPAPAKGGKGAPAGAPAPPAGQLPHSSSTATVTLKSDQLGVFLYDLRLKSVPAGAEPALRLTCSLGGKQTVAYRFKSFEPAASTVYKVATTRPDVFTVPPTVTVAAADVSAAWGSGIEGSLEVAAEGVALGDVSGELTLTSDTSGCVYTVPLVATCTAPRPAGPFVIAPNGAATIEFRNVFSEDREFAVSTDNPAVFLAVPCGLVKVAKKSGVNISVKYVPPAGAAEDITGRMVVSCPAMPELRPWVFYLRGSAAPPPAATPARPASGAAGKKK